MPFFFVFCVGMSTDPVSLSAYSSLGVDLGEVFDRSKDKPALIMLIAFVGFWSTLTFLIVGGPLSDFVIGGCCVFGGRPGVDALLSSIVMDLMSEFALLPLQVVIGNESDDDLTRVNTRRSFVCCSCLSADMFFGCGESTGTKAC